MMTTEQKRICFATNQLKSRIREQGRHGRFLARQIGVSDSHFSRVLSGERWITEANAKVISSILGVDFFVLWKVSNGTKIVPIEQQETTAA